MKEKRFIIFNNSKEALKSGMCILSEAPSACTGGPRQDALDGAPALAGAPQDSPQHLSAAPNTSLGSSSLKVGWEGGLGPPSRSASPPPPPPASRSLTAPRPPRGGGLGAWPGPKVLWMCPPCPPRPLPFFENWELSGWVCSHHQCSSPGSLK